MLSTTHRPLLGVAEVVSLASIRVPRDASNMLVRVATAHPDGLERLNEALSTAQEVLSIGDFKRIVAESIPALGDEASEMATHLLSISALRSSHGFAALELTERIVESLPGEPEAGVNDRLSKFLAGLLGTSSIQGLTKAIDISREQDRFLHLSRIVTDVRPVFGDDPAGGPLGTLLVQTLRLDYFEEGRVKSLGFVVDSQDLASLKEGIARAEAKAQSLEESVDSFGWKVFKLNEDEA